MRRQGIRQAGKERVDQSMIRDVQLAQQVNALMEVVKQIVAALHEKGITLEQKTETGLVVPPGVKL